jgi:hypothetical protein
MAVYKNLPLLWHGKSMTGKTTSIKRSIKRAIESLFPHERKFIKIPIDKMLNSRKLTKVLDDKISIKNEVVTDDVIIYIDNVNMCIEESEELLRYLSEYDSLFAEKTKTIVKIPKLTKIMDGSFSKGKWVSRLSRHFA